MRYQNKVLPNITLHLQNVRPEEWQTVGTLKVLAVRFSKFQCSISGATSLPLYEKSGNL